MSDDGYFLRVNGTWTPIPGVQSGVGIETARARSEFVSLGGVRHEQVSLRAPRTWNLPLGQLAGPGQTAALMMAAQGDAGDDVMLWDESVARANLLDPVAVAPRPEYPVVDCGGIPVRSLTMGPTQVDLRRDYRAFANASVRQSDGLTYPTVQMTSGGVREALVRFNLQPAPAGYVLSSAQLLLTGTGTSGIDIYRAYSNWYEPADWTTLTNYWTATPALGLMGSAPAVAGTWTAWLSTSQPQLFDAASISFRLRADSGSVVVTPRTTQPGYPQLRLRYVESDGSRRWSQYLKAGKYWLSFWTNATTGTVVGTMQAGTVTTNIVAPAGSGVRRVSLPLDNRSNFDRNWAFTIHESFAYLLAGVAISTVDHAEYLPPAKTPVQVSVDDPTLTLDGLYPGQQGLGQRGVTIREVG